jgi:DNA-binding transcriptional MerR regulator
MRYTVKKLSEMAGVSIRTLHYYDEIGLLKPMRKEESNYRYYDFAQLKRLQQILYFRELEFSLEEIKKILDAPHFDAIKAMFEQKKLLEMQRDRLNTLIETLTNAIEKEKGGETMNDDQIYAGLSKQQIEEYKKEAKDRWGETDAYKQSMERVKSWTKNDWDEIKSESAAIYQAIADNMDKGIESKEIQEQIAKHHNHINRFYDCSLEIYQGLGNMYVADPRFTAFYEKIKPGMAQFMHEAMDFYCQKPNIQA